MITQIIIVATLELLVDESNYLFYIDIFYAKLYNEKFNQVIKEWFNIQEFNQDDYNYSKDEIQGYLYYIE